MAEEAVYKIDRVDKVSRSVKAFQRFVEQSAPHGVPTDRAYFDALMRQEKKVDKLSDQQQKVQLNDTERPSLMEEMRKVNRKVTGLQKASSVDLIAQAQDAVGKIESLKKDLATPGLEIKNSVQRLLKGKLANINEGLKVAFAKAGIEYVPPEQRNLRENPVSKYLDYLAHGQGQLEGLTGHIEGLAASGKELAPGDLLALQIKVGHIQQELEFFSGLLNKALESTKTLMNVQV